MLASGPWTTEPRSNVGSLPGCTSSPKVAGVPSSAVYSTWVTSDTSRARTPSPPAAGRKRRVAARTDTETRNCLCWLKNYAALFAFIQFANVDWNDASPLKRKVPYHRRESLPPRPRGPVPSVCSRRTPRWSPAPYFACPRPGILPSALLWPVSSIVFFCFFVFFRLPFLRVFSRMKKCHGESYTESKIESQKDTSAH